MPIKYVLDALDAWRSRQSLTIYSLAMGMKAEPISYAEGNYGMREPWLVKELARVPKYSQRVLMIDIMNPQFRKENPGLQKGDVIMKVNDVVIGPDFSKLHDEVMERGRKGQKVHLTLNRYGQTLEMDVKPLSVPHESIKATEFELETFLESNSTLSYYYGVETRKPIIFRSPNKGTQAFTIRRVDNQPVNSFDEMVQIFHRLISAGKTIFMLSADDGTPDSERHVSINLSMKKHQPWFVMKRDLKTQEWAGIEYKDYVAALSTPQVASSRKRTRAVPMDETPAKKQPPRGKRKR